jgi:hypothetical protein
MGMLNERGKIAKEYDKEQEEWETCTESMLDSESGRRREGTSL